MHSGTEHLGSELMRHRARRTGFGPPEYLVWAEVEGPAEPFWIVRVLGGDGGFIVLSAWDCSTWQCDTVFSHWPHNCEEVLALQAAHRCGHGR